MDSPVIWLLNDQNVNGSTTSQENSTNYLNIGANDPTIEFSAAKSRTTIFNLHTQMKLGVNMVAGYMDNTPGTDLVLEDLGNPIIKFSDTKFPFFGYFDFTNTIVLEQPPFDTITWSPGHRNVGRCTTTSGLAIIGIYGQGQGDIQTNVSAMTPIVNSDMFTDCLLNKLGFVYTDLFPKYGKFINWHDPATQGTNDPDLLYYSVKPLTTNASLTIADQPSMALQDKTHNPSALGLPTYKLGYPGLIEFNLDGDTSTQIVATNLPIKSESAFYQIYSDIVDSEYLSKNQKMNIVGLVPKYFIGGDFIYTQSMEYSFPVMFPRNIRQIKTEIRTPDGKLAPINSKSSVIYKVSRQVLLPTLELMAQEFASKK
tara:strand:- start:740 stop:1849 length:1110 start_codon:yes stop_codon:yes gene_type:complete